MADSKKPHILIVGGSKRVGFHVASFFANQGNTLTILYRSPTAELKALCENFSSNCSSYSFDLRQVSRYPDLVKQIVKERGSVSVVISFASQFYKTPVPHITETQWDDLFDTNVKGHFFLLQSILPFLESPGGQIINLIDIFATRPIKGYLAYTAAKSALLRLTKNLALELAPGVRVNSVSPGSVLMPENFSPDEIEKHKENTLLKRIGTPDDILQAILFLMENKYVTGVDLAVDGGSSLS
jgi:pteridine reductase